jgi:hypothetical protein
MCPTCKACCPEALLWLCLCLAPDLVQPAAGGAGAGCNFQRASVTLDASVKIYGSRVDCVHTIAFQTLSGLSRSAQATAAAAQAPGAALLATTVVMPGTQASMQPALPQLHAACALSPFSQSSKQKSRAIYIAVSAWLCAARAAGNACTGHAPFVGTSRQQ